MKHKHCVNWNMARNSQKKWKMRNAHGRIWSMQRKLKNIKNETQTLSDLEYGKKHSRKWKMRNAHCRTWSKARKLKIT
jgi:hypothetical protein